MTQTTATVVEAAVTPAVKLTRIEQLMNRYNALTSQVDARNIEIAKIVEEVNAINALAAVGEGSVVNVKVGKGDTASTVLATVIGVRLEEDGSKTYKVSYGVGFDADVKVVKSWQISLPVAADTPVEATEPAAE